jgi:hypothetical protein
LLAEAVPDATPAPPSQHSVVGLCIAAGGSVVKAYAGIAAFTLAWTHSVQKTEWEEDWHIVDSRLVLVEARVQGTGAGMEPPPESRFDGRFWRWTPTLAPLSEVVLRRSGATDDWRLCVNSACQPLSTVLPANADPVVLSACADAGNPR